MAAHSNVRDILEIGFSAHGQTVSQMFIFDATYDPARTGYQRAIVLPGFEDLRTSEFVKELAEFAETLGKQMKISV